MTINEALSFPIPYWAYAFTVSAGFYGVVTWLGNRHFSNNATENLTLWLWGEYESTWTQQFGTLFDAVFGEKHLSWRCFWRSSLVSVTTVMVLYVLLVHVLGIISVRVDDTMPLWQVLLLGTAINIFPDYLSLFETRWLLKKFETVNSFWGQLLVLIADAVFTGAIILLSITAFRLLHGDAPLAAIELIALFSVYALFFYSTFVTSLWAWVYCLSTWIMRLFSHSFLKNILDVEHKPVSQVALVSSILVFLFAAALTPFLSTPEGEHVTKLDRWLCSNVSSEVCKHVVRLTPDEKQTLNILTRACEGGGTEYCVNIAFKYLKGDKQKAFQLWKKACDGNVMLGCLNMGVMYKTGAGVERDMHKALELYRQACDGGEMSGCHNLGAMYEDGLGVDRDAVKAFELFRFSCSKGEMEACNSLGGMYEKGTGVKRDIAKAVELLHIACDSGSVMGCMNLEVMHEKGTNIKRDAAKTIELYRQACNSGKKRGCTLLGTEYATGTDVERDVIKAVELFRKTCNYSDMLGCTYLGNMYANGTGIKQDSKKAVELYRQACDSGELEGCIRLGTMYEKGMGTERDAAKAIELYNHACDSGMMSSCVKLADMYENGSGIEQNTAKAANLYRRVCDRGYMEGCFKFKFMNKNVIEDASTTITFYRKACTDGEMQSCFNLAVMFNTGTGVEQDVPLATALFRQACDGGNDYACRMLKELNTAQ